MTEARHASPPVSSQLSSFLNLVRWFAAFLVVINHARCLIFVDYEHLEQKSIFTNIFYLLTGLGHEAVVVFFVISGYLVGGLTWERWRASGPAYRAYASARISRIYTVLIPGLLAGLALDLIGLNFFNASGLYTNPDQYAIVSLVGAAASRIDFQTFVGNVLMLQGVATSNFGSNAPLWSLACEWWYYCIFAVVAVVFTGRGTERIICALLGAALIFLLPAQIVFGGGAIWVLGILARLWISSGLMRPHPAFGILLLAVSLVAGKIFIRSDQNLDLPWLPLAFVKDFLVGISFVVAMAGVSRMTWTIPSTKLSERLADFSFSVYVFHFPAIFVLVAIACQTLGMNLLSQPDAGSLAAFTSLVLLVYGYCFLCAQLTERHTGAVRKKISS